MEDGIAGAYDWLPVVATLSKNVNLASAPGANVMTDGAYLVDGVTTPARILLMAQTNPAENGIYEYNYNSFFGGSSWTRTTDADAAVDFRFGRRVWVRNGMFAGQAITCITDQPVVGTDAINFKFPQVAVYAENLTESTSTATGGFIDPTGGTAGPQVPFTIPPGGRFVDFQAECEGHHTINNTDGIWFALAFSKDAAAFTVNPPAGYQNSTTYMDTSSNPVAIGASMWFADTVYRPMRLGQSRMPKADGTSSYLFPSASNVFLPAGVWIVKMVYGMNSGASGTAYFRTRRLRAQILPH